MRHPHADLIKEWAEDTSRVVQVRVCENGKWEDYSYENPDFDPEYEWRFKPEPKPDVVRHVMLCSDNGWSTQCKTSNLRATFDGETGKLIKAEVIECAP